VVDLRDDGDRVVVGSTRKRENVGNKKIGMSSSRSPKNEGLLFFKGLLGEKFKSKDNSHNHRKISDKTKLRARLVFIS
jgi:hypothetical protein